MGMTPLACWMVQSGYNLVGVDDHLREANRKLLEQAGVELRDFVLEEHLSQFTTLVYSSAIQPQHPVRIAAEKLGLNSLRRGELLAQLSRSKKMIAVVGSHGKTTTSGMIAHLLQQTQTPANFILGGLFEAVDRPPYYSCDSEWLIAEVDESDGTIDHFDPYITVVLNLDWDHADRYTSSHQLEEAFRQLIQRTRSKVLVPASCAIELLQDEELAGKIEAYHLDLAEGSPFTNGFNRSNAAAAIATLNAICPAPVPANALNDFCGMARRQSVRLQRDGLTVIEDYAHHPTEISALLEQLRRSHSGARIIAVFQPHRYSRTKQFKAEFAQSLRAADEVFLLPLYAAFEAQVAGGTLVELSAAFGAVAPEQLSLDLAGVMELAQACESRSGETCVVFIGAGDIDGFAAVFSEWIRSNREISTTWLNFVEREVSAQCKLRLNEPMAAKTTLRVGGAAHYYAEPANLVDLRALMRSAKLFGLETFCMGRGSNLLVSDAGFEGLVIRFSAPRWRRMENLPGQRIWVGAGARLKEVCGQAARAGMSGFEFLEGIPGAVGGALRMNAGAMGNWMFDVVESVYFIDAGGCLQHWPKQDFHFGYRKVEEISQGIALGAILKSPESDAETSIRARMDSYSSSRKESQPRDPSAGCIFKNPEGNIAGKLIDEYQLKGMQVGQAEVSAVHGNFIINRGGATAADVIELIRRVRKIIKAKSGYELEPEVLLVGASWDAVLADLPQTTTANGPEE